MLLSCHIRYFTVPNLCHLAPLWAYYIHFSIISSTIILLQLQYYMEVYRELSIRIKTNCGFSTLPDLPGIYTNPYERQKHPYQRRFLSFLFSHFMFLCKLSAPLIGTSNTLLTKLFLANGSVLLKNSRFTSAKNSSTRSYPYWIPG